MIESYANPELGVRSTIVEVPDIDDQLEMPYQAHTA